MHAEPQLQGSLESGAYSFPASLRNTQATGLGEFCMSQAVASGHYLMLLFES